MVSSDPYYVMPLGPKCWGTLVEEWRDRGKMENPEGFSKVIVFTFV